jgi:RNA polymerase sigma factor (sigma-70 family)
MVRVSELLMAWRPTELRVARGFAECRELDSAELEDLYQETALALIHRPYLSEEHLRYALRWGLKHRARRAHRDEHRHSEIAIDAARERQAADATREQQENPEALTLSHEDRLVVAEFLTELDAEERRVFWLMAEGMSYWAIATAHGSTAGEARKVVRSCQKKLDWWLVLYKSGRLCGYRHETIQALLDGQHTSEQLASSAIAHLERCAHCRAEHQTNARKLRVAFKEQAAGLLAPMLLTRAGWLTRLAVRTRLLHSRLPGADHLSAARDRATLLLSNGGVGSQIARGLTAAAVLTAGAAGATHALQQPSTPHHRATHRPTQHLVVQPRAARVSSPPSYGTPTQPISSTRPAQPTAPGHVVEHRPADRSPEGTVEPGFAYLGVPAPRPRRVPNPSPEDQQGGGPFGP